MSKRGGLSREQEKAMFAGQSNLGSGITRADMEHVPGYHLTHPKSTSRIYAERLVSHARGIKNIHSNWKKMKSVNQVTEKDAKTIAIAAEQKEKVKQLNLDLNRIKSGDISNDEAKKLLKDIKANGEGIIPSSTINEIEKIVKEQLKTPEKERRGISKVFPGGAHNPTTVKIVENINTGSKPGEQKVNNEKPEEVSTEETEEPTKESHSERIRKTISQSDIPDKLKAELLAVDPQVAV